MTLGERIKNARVKKGMTQADLAKSLKTTKAAISRYELDQRQPRYKLMEEIARTLDVDIYELFTGFTKEEWSNRIDEEVDRYWSEVEETFVPGRAKELVDIFLLLNDEGQQKAVERVEELTEIPKYQKEPPQD